MDSTDSHLRPLHAAAQSSVAEFGDAARLRALARYEILDTPAEAQFDRVVALARVLFDAPMAAISLIDEDRQWFKARSGIDPTQTARDISFCHHTIQNETPFVVPDALLDSRFAANPLVVGEPGIRFYAGAPLRTPCGHNLGALCVISNEPRGAFSATDARRLEVLAAIVVNELELKIQAEKARKLAEEKEFLLREAHHRIKNSLQLVNVVLQAQASRAADAATREILQDAADRVVTIGTVHKQLYRSKSVREADALSYLTALTSDLQRAIGHELNDQGIVLSAPADLLVSADSLPKLGLVVTELLMNAIRHGAGRVTVSLQPDGENVVVGVADEGEGFPEDFDPGEKRTSLGLTLVRRLAAPGGVWIDPLDRRRIFARMVG